MTHELFIQVVRSTTKMQAAVDNLGEAEAARRLRALLGHHHPTGKFEVPYISDLVTGQHRGNPPLRNDCVDTAARTEHTLQKITAKL